MRLLQNNDYFYCFEKEINLKTDQSDFTKQNIVDQ